MTTDIAYDEEKHEYRQNGIVVPSVTTICKILDPLPPFIPKEEMAWLANRGHAIHTATELLEEDDLAWDMLDERIVPQVRAWAKFIADTGFMTYESEVRVDHFGFGYAGRLDRIGWFPSKGHSRKPEKLVILDIKSGAPTLAAGPQTAAYMAAWNTQNQGMHRVTARYVVQLTEEGEAKLHLLTNPHDFRAFEAALVIHQWRNSQ